VDEEPDISEAQAWGQLSKMLSEKYADQHHASMYFFFFYDHNVPSYSDSPVADCDQKRLKPRRDKMK
jgi:hypothetical protein